MYEMTIFIGQVEDLITHKDAMDNVLEVPNSDIWRKAAETIAPGASAAQLEKENLPANIVDGEAACAM
jgi:hypothetical protein